MNIYNFVSINIMPDGSIYANIDQSALGNIQTHSIHEILINRIT